MDDTVFGEVGQTEVGDVTPVASPAEETPATTPEQRSPQETNVPFNQHPRWKEVYEKSRKVDTLEQQLQQLQQQMSQGKQGEQNWQPKTWEEVLQKAAELGEQRVFERAQRQQEELTQQEQQEDTALEEAWLNFKSQHPEVDQRKLYETAQKYGVGDLDKAFEIMQMVGEAEKRGEKQALKKTIAPIGSSKKTQGGAKSQTPYKAFKGRTLDDIVADAAEQISG